MQRVRHILAGRDQLAVAATKPRRTPRRFSKAAGIGGWVPRWSPGVSRGAGRVPHAGAAGGRRPGVWRRPIARCRRFVRCGVAGPALANPRRHAAGWRLRLRPAPDLARGLTGRRVPRHAPLCGIWRGNGRTSMATSDWDDAAGHGRASTATRRAEARAVDQRVVARSLADVVIVPVLDGHDVQLGTVTGAPGGQDKGGGDASKAGTRHPGLTPSSKGAQLLIAAPAVTPDGDPAFPHHV